MSDRLEKTILYLDDERENLDGFRFNFRKEYNIFLAGNTNEAFDIIRENQIKVVLSDNKMPDMLGTDFFELLSTSNPDIVRILVTAFADTEAAMQAINKGKVYRFITKPWNKNELKIAIENAFETFDLRTQNLALIDNLSRKNFELEDLNFKMRIEISEKQKAEEELSAHKTNLEEIVELRTKEIAKINEELNKYQGELEEIVRQRTQQLHESELRLRTLSNNLPGGAIFMGYTKPDDTDYLVYASANIAEITGISLENLLSSIGTFFNNIHPEDIRILIDARHESLASLKLLDLELRYMLNEYETKWLHLRMMYRRGNDDLVWWDGYVIDISDKKYAEKAAKDKENTIRNIQEGIATKTGEKLLETIVIKLSETLKANYIFIAQRIKDKSKVKTLINCIDGQCAENIEYDLEYTPCEIVINGMSLSYKSGLHLHYPDAQLINSLKAEGYVGVPLLDSQSQIIGIMVAIFTKPVNDIIISEQILEIFSSRVGAELERIRSEQAIQLYSDVAYNMQVALNVFQLENFSDDTSLVLIKANPASGKIINQISEKLAGKKFDEIYPQLKGYGIENILAEVVRTGKPYNNEEFRFFPESGEIFFYNLKAFRVPNDCVGILFEDITRKKRIEKAVKESEERYRALFDKSPNGIHLVGTNGPATGKLVSFNPKVSEMLGYTNTELNGMPVELIMRDLSQADRSKHTECLVAGETIIFETNFYRKDKSSFPVEITASIISLADQLFILGIDRDITEIKIAERRLKENVQFLSTLVETIPLPIFYKDKHGLYLGCNSLFENYTGYKRDQLVGKSVYELFPEEYAKIYMDADETLLTHETTQRYEGKMVDASGNIKDIIFNKARFTDSEGNVIGLIGAMFDITEQKQTERLIFESQQKLLNIFNSSSDGIVIVDFNFEIIDINETLLRMVGYNNINQVVHKPIDLIPAEYHPRVFESIEKFKRGETTPSVEMEIIHLDGHFIPVDVSSKIISLGDTMAILTIIRDITERKNIENKLLETVITTEEKERERFAGNLHDEVGPLLSSLKMYLSLLAETEDKSKKDYIIPQVQTLIKEAIQTVREISNDLSPHVLNNYGCLAAINAFISLKKDFLKINFIQDIDNKRYSTNVEIILYRIIKELLTNTIKHAKATEVNISLRDESNQIRLIYKDNGEGFDVDSLGQKAGSIGLLNIVSRIKTINGKHKIISAKGEGFIYELVVPIT
jgi:PAS domain S-box-containing protein